MSSKTVVVAMSGGVDSAVAAYLLKKQGYELIGITLWLFEQDERIKDAQKIADKIGIRHYLLDFRNIFKQRVIADFYEQYQRGRTPNPCIRCNQHIKFGDLLFEELKNRFKTEFLASGHYVRVERAEPARRSLGAGGSKEQRAKGREEIQYLLKKGIDAKKDQSYFLYTLSQRQLNRILFPLGNLSKQEVKQIAQNLSLLLNRTESQDVCFARDADYTDMKSGLIIDREGKVLGRHRGIAFYTIGQRKRIGAFGRPMFVVAIDAAKNLIVVGERNELYKDELIAEEVNWINGKELTSPLTVKAKIRYLHQPSTATVIPLSKDKVHPVKSLPAGRQAPGGIPTYSGLFNRVKVKFAQPQWAITPGQAVVFYNGEEVIGGGTIEKCF